MQKTLIFVALFLVLALPSSLFAQSDESFKSLVDTGVQSYSAGDYHRAIDAFKRASEIRENADVTYNIARSYHRLNDCQNALSYYAKFQSQVTSSEDKQAVEKFIKELADCKQEGKLLPLCSPANASVRVDDSQEMLSCGNIHKIAVGNRKLSFEADGFETVKRMVNIVAQQTTTVSVTLDGNKPDQKQPVEETEIASHKMEVPTKSACDLCRSSEGANWLGLGLVIGGGTSSLLGGILLAASYSKYSESQTLYSKKAGAYYSGVIFTSLGVLSTAAGVLVLIFDWRINTKASRVAVSPIFETGKDSASAGIHLRF
ncbi:MAG: tetratricopeptide repeat protein [Bradymonadales bacterium]